MILFIYTSEFGRICISDSRPFWREGRWRSDDEIEMDGERYLRAMLKNIHSFPLPAEYLEYDTYTHEARLWGDKLEFTTRKYFITLEGKFLQSYDLTIPSFNWTEDVDNMKVFNTLSKVNSVKRRIRNRDAQCHILEYHE